ncbi:OsmC family peroxiredoxin [Thermus scotoductus]|jgi:putative redox protein|uniref:OsmC family peroxiredoxin n=1 Tax=Thermus scotoductus TaxID=37636 RepID=A0A348XQK1_THESC|nr:MULTISPECIES: OsmC family protein [Thermus]ETN88084.1 OsmC family protein [Thermus sp. NMX2.A1]RTG93808.1 OsmC family peroxiredoxin [Thermus scotoductus]RTG96469.1 OsmC family peroxiredoxin [Thermus scotoductus]RTG98796.1 OsmC family peroxiredoxin [Thermus scotoductus]RTH01879.1 OsmC family peroxiredoxin [Thermus scotoductus]
MTKKVVIHHLVGHRFLGMNEQGDKVMIDGDQPATGPRPMELLLMALGACTAYDVVDIMKKKKQPLARYRVEVEGIRAETHPRRYTHITVTHIASGPNVTLEALERAAHLSHTKYCSVSASLNAEITVKVVLEPWEEGQETQG